MRRLKIRILLMFMVVISVLFAVSVLIQKKPVLPDGPSWAQVVLHRQDRLLILSPHPDDEVLGCGGIIQQAVAMGIPVHIVFFTYGDFYEWSFIVYKKWPVLTPKGVMGMGEVRHDEALAAASTLGVSKENVEFLGYPDFGTLEMWYRAWGKAQPIKGILTKAAAVPYENAVRPGAPYKGEEVLKDLTSIVCEFRPTKIFVSHPADHHPDHRALYLFTRVALFNVEKEISPDVYTYLVHYTKWPIPEGRFPDKSLEPPVFLRKQIAWRVSRLSSQQTEIKSAALKKHRTQYQTASKFLNSFVRENELFGDFPTVTLHTQAPSYLPLGNMAYEPAEKTGIIEEEKAAFIGIVGWAMNIDDAALVLSIELTSPLTNEIGSSVYLFGYRSDTPFSQMPKIHIKLGPITHKVYDASQEADFGKIQVAHLGRHINIRVPLEMIGSPERILTSVRTYAGDIPLDWAPWRIIAVDDMTAASAP